MRLRPVRPNIYLPVIRFGVADKDWFPILVISCVCHLAPIPFGIMLLYVPLQMWTWLVGTAGAIAFFNYIRIGRKPCWLQHQLASVLFSHRQHRFIPNMRRRKFAGPWLTDGPHGADSTLTKSSSLNSVIFDMNNRLTEVCVETWLNG